MYTHNKKDLQPVKQTRRGVDVKVRNLWETQCVLCYLNLVEVEPISTSLFAG